MFNTGSVIKGRCHLVFHAWKEDGEVSWEDLDSSAWEESHFDYHSKEDYEKGMISNPSEYLNEHFKYSDDKDILMEQIVSEIEFVEGDDRYFEFVADYAVTTSRDYWGEWDSESEITNDKWQEISKEEWCLYNDV